MEVSERQVGAEGMDGGSGERREEQGRGHGKPLCSSLAAWFKVADKLE